MTLHRWQRMCAIVIILALSAIVSVDAANTLNPPSFEITQTASIQPHKQAALPATSAAGAQIAKSPQAAVTPVVSAPQCSRPTNYSPPAAMAVSIEQPGFHQSIQAPFRYTVYGNNVAETNSQIASCTPINESEGRFAASTDYSINWVVSYRTRADGLCYINQASVGLNTAQAFPAWQATAGSSAAMASIWQKFITNLTTHENGHLQLDQSGAAQIYNDLINLPAADCGSIAAAAKARSNADMAALNQANADYDAATGHGTTQGAVLGL